MRDDELYSQTMSNDAYYTDCADPTHIYRRAFGSTASVAKRWRARADPKKSDGLFPTDYWAYDFTIIPERQAIRLGSYCSKHTIDGERVDATLSNYTWTSLSQSYLKSDGVDTYGRPIVSSNCQNEAVTKALNGIADSKLNLGVALAEAKSSASLVANTSIRVIRAYRAARRGQWNNVAKELGVDKIKRPKDMAGGWLAYKFGWLPLLSDIYNAREGIRDAFDKPMLIQSKGFAEYTTTRNSSGSTLRFSDMRTTHGTQVGLTYEPTDEWIAGLNTLNLLNPLSIAWEVVPYSFVLDWFLPVGNVLSALSAPMGLRYLHGYKTKFVKVKGEIWSYPDAFLHGIYLKRGFAFEREVLLSSPSPSLYVTSGLNFSKAATLITLAAQRYG